MESGCNRYKLFDSDGTLNIIGITARIYSSKAVLAISILASSGILMLVGGLMVTATSITFGELHGLQISHISTRLLLSFI